MDQSNDNVTDAVIECEYVYEEGSIDDGTYVYEEESKKPSTNHVIPEVTYENEKINADDFDPGEYVLERNRTKDSDRIEIPIPGKGRPSHKKTIAGVYDDLYDYDTDPQPSVVNSDTTLLEDKYRWSVQRKIFVWCILGVGIGVAISAGLIYSLLGRYSILSFQNLLFRKCY